MSSIRQRLFHYYLLVQSNISEHEENHETEIHGLTKKELCLINHIYWMIDFVWFQIQNLGKTTTPNNNYKSIIQRCSLSFIRNLLCYSVIWSMSSIIFWIICRSHSSLHRWLLLNLQRMATTVRSTMVGWSSVLARSLEAARSMGILAEGMLWHIVALDAIGNTDFFSPPFSSTL